MVVVTILLLVAVGFFIYTSSSGPDAKGALVSYDPAEGDVLPVTVEIARDADVAVECAIVAVDDRQIIVGQLLLEVPAGPETRLRVDAEIPLQGDGIAAKLNGCRPA
jgi:hypothetical protein